MRVARFGRPYPAPHYLLASDPFIENPHRPTKDTTSVRRIALDIAGTEFTEAYRIGVYHGIIDYARKHTDWKLLYNVRQFSLIHRYTSYEELATAGAEGIILYTRNPEKIEAIQRTGLPAVSISSDLGNFNLPTVTSDDVEVGRTAGRHFLERGFVNYAFTGSSEVSWEIHRRQGFEEIAAALGFRCHFFRDEKIGNSETDRRTAQELATWLKDLPRPIAIMGADDGRALHVLEACNDMGIAVPREIAIVGVDNNVLVCDSLLPSLSSVAQNTERVGWEAAALLDSILQGKEMGTPQIVIPPRGVVTRMSSDIMAVDDEALGRALTFIRDHLAEQFSIEQLARVAGVSRSSLEKRFRARLGVTTTDMIRDQRLRRAKMLMVETTMPLKAIAEAAGFRRATYFSNVFRDQMGESPGQWRARHEATARRMDTSGRLADPQPGSGRQRGLETP